MILVDLGECFRSNKVTMLKLVGGGRPDILLDSRARSAIGRDVENWCRGSTSIRHARGCGSKQQ
jgi:hypothetical protein